MLLLWGILVFGGVFLIDDVVYNGNKKSLNLINLINQVYITTVKKVTCSSNDSLSTSSVGVNSVATFFQNSY